jgi:hypothetical protein
MKAKNWIKMLDSAAAQREREAFEYLRDRLPGSEGSKYKSYSEAADSIVNDVAAFAENSDLVVSCSDMQNCHVQIMKVCHEGLVQLRLRSKRRQLSTA